MCQLYWSEYALVLHIPYYDSPAAGWVKHPKPPDSKCYGCLYRVSGLGRCPPMLAPGPLAQFVLCNATYIILIYFLVSLLSVWPLLLKTHHNLILHSLSKTVLRACLATASAKFVNTHIEAASSSILNVLTRHFLNTICSCW